MWEGKCAVERRDLANTVEWVSIWKNNPHTKLVDVEDKLGQLADRDGGGDSPLYSQMLYTDVAMKNHVYNKPLKPHHLIMSAFDIMPVFT